MHMIVVNKGPKWRENKYSRYIQTEWCDEGNAQNGLGGVVGWGVLKGGRGGERYKKKCVVRLEKRPLELGH